jgi:serine/threonine-protein kinase
MFANLSLPPSLTTSVLAGKYRVLRPLVAPGEPVVRAGVARLLCEHASIGRDVEVKILVEPTDEGRERLFREARALGGVSHRSTRSVLDSGEDSEKRPFVVYEALVGPSLAERLAEHPHGLGAEGAASLAMQILEGLRALHRSHVIVRALAPQTIQLVSTKTGEVAKLASLEHASFVGEATALEPVRFSPWAAPEIRRRGEHFDARADVYSAGVMLRHLLTGRPQDGLPLPDTADRAVARATAEDPDERFPTVDVLMQCVALMLPTEERPPRDQMVLPRDSLAADLQWLSLRRSTRHGTMDGAPRSTPPPGGAAVHLLTMLVTIEAIYRRVGERAWHSLVEAVPAIEDVLPGSGHTSEHLHAGVPMLLLAQFLERADELVGAGDLALVSEVGEAIAQRSLRRLWPELPAVISPDAIIDGFPYMWSRIARDGAGVVADRGEVHAKLLVQNHAAALEVTGLTAAILRGALREAGARNPSVSILRCAALGDTEDAFIARWS